MGWREYFVSDGAGLTRIDPGNAPVQAYLGTLGMPGLTAYCGLLDIGRPAEGETVFVSAAAGAVGSIVCQIARIKGCRVVGSAGSDEKVAWLKEAAGADEAFNYKTAADLAETLGRLTPDGIDVYYENVGGRHLAAALDHMNTRGRIVMCGMIDQYNAVKPPAGPANLGYVILKQLRMQGFIVMDFMDRMPRFHADMGQWIAEGKIKWKETVMEGIENAPAAFIGLFTGKKGGYKDQHDQAVPRVSVFRAHHTPRSHLLKYSPCLTMGRVLYSMAAISCSLSGENSEAIFTFCSICPTLSTPMMVVLTGRLIL